MEKQKREELAHQLQEECKQIVKENNSAGLKEFLKKHNVHIGNDFLFRLACRKGKLDLVKILVTTGANIFVNSDEAFEEAVKRNHYDVVDYLVANSNGYFLKKAVNNAINNKVDLLNLLISRKADLNYSNGWALKTAVEKQLIEVVITLLSGGANVNINNGIALQTAVENQSIEMINILLEAGADVHVNNDSIINLALASEDEEIIQLILSKV